MAATVHSKYLGEPLRHFPICFPITSLTWSIVFPFAYCAPLSGFLSTPGFCSSSSLCLAHFFPANSFISFSPWLTSRLLTEAYFSHPN